MNDKTQAQTITDQYLADCFSIELSEAKEIYSKMERIIYEGDDSIVTVDDVADGLYFIDEGQTIAYDNNGNIVNEMDAGQFFGEYAVLTSGQRMVTVKAHGHVVVYRMSSAEFLQLVGRHPNVTGYLLKQVYGQVSEKHTKLVSIASKHRGVMRNSSGKKENSPLSIGITYGITAIIFLIVIFFAPDSANTNIVWQLLPVAFLLGFTLWTKRIVEGMLLTVLLLAGILNQGHFVSGFGKIMIEGFSNPDTSETLFIMAMVEAVAALLAASGVISAFKKLAGKYVKSRTSSMFGMLFIMIFVCLDECLNVITAGYSMNDSADRCKIPRESRALLGSFSTGLCAVIPFSLWGAYISGWTAMYQTQDNLFLRSIPFNLAAVGSLLFSVLLCVGFLPKTKQMRMAYDRVKEGGFLWPAGSVKYFDTESENHTVGRPINLLLPMAVWVVSSVTYATVKNGGKFAMNAVFGLVTTLIFMFFLYISQRLMTPKTFFEILADGIANALMPMLLFVLSERITYCLGILGFGEVIKNAILSVVGKELFLIPMLLFVVFTLLCLGLGSSWGMYGLGIPVSIFLSNNLGLSVPLCLGAILAAGIAGESLCPYLDDTAPVVTAIGCEPVAYRKIRLQYWLPIVIICAIVYIILGLLF